MGKYALLIGISYSNTKMYLPGVKNDLQTMTGILKNWGFDLSNITILSEAHIFPTSYNINNNINRFCSRLSEGDTAVIYYSGHGTRNFNRQSRYEESCLVPLDYSKAGHINSETVRYYLNKIASNVNVMCIFDCCNSGTVCNLKYHMYDTSFRKDITIKLKKYDTQDWVTRNKYKISDLVSISKSQDLETEANIISISGCWDTQVSYDLGRNGALTLAFLNTISSNRLENLTLEKLLQELRGRIIQIRVKQTPQMMLGNSMDVNTNLRNFLRF